MAGNPFLARLGLNSISSIALAAGLPVTDTNTSLKVELGSDPGSFTAASDTPGLDTYFRGQTGGADAGSDPRGGDLILIPGAAGAGGSGRDGRLQVEADALVSGQVDVLSTTASTSSTTGALVVAGGVGIGGDLNVGSEITAAGEYHQFNTDVDSQANNWAINPFMQTSRHGSASQPTVFAQGGTGGTGASYSAVFGRATTRPANGKTAIGVTGLGSYSGSYSGRPGDRIGVYGQAESLDGEGADGYIRIGVDGFGYSSDQFTANTVYGMRAKGECAAAANGALTYGIEAVAVGAATSATAYGIYATASGAIANWAGYFEGNVTITGGDGTQALSILRAGQPPMRVRQSNDAAYLQFFNTADTTQVAGIGYEETADKIFLGHGNNIAGPLAAGLVINADNTVTVQDTTASTSATTGALVVAGGVGVAGSVNVNGMTNIGSGAAGGTTFLLNVQGGSADQNLLRLRRANSLGGRFDFTASSNKPSIKISDQSGSTGSSVCIGRTSGTVRGALAYGVDSVDAGGSNILEWDAANVYVNGNATVTGKLTVGGLIDPTGLELTPVASNPGGVAANTIWLSSTAPERLQLGADAVFGNWSTEMTLGSIGAGTGGVRVSTTVGSGGSITFQEGTLVDRVWTIYQNNSSLIFERSGTDHFQLRGDGQVDVLSTTASTGSTNGALTVGGGVGIGGDLFVAGHLDLNHGTITTDEKTLNSTVTWNNGALAFTAWKLDVTDMMSSGSSKLMALQVGGVDKFAVSKFGNVSAPNLLLAHNTITTDEKTLNSTVTWNNGALAFTAWKLDVTDMMSSGSSKLMALQVGGVDKFAVSKFGDLAWAGNQTGSLGDADTSTIGGTMVIETDAAVSNKSMINITDSTYTLDLPGTIVDGRIYAIKNTSGSNATIGRRDNKIDGITADYTLPDGESRTFVGDSSAGNWIVF